MKNRPHSVTSLKGVRVLVTGGSGFLGSHLVEGLLAEGAIVGSLSRSSGLALARFQQCVQLRCNLSDAEQTKEVIAGFSPEVVFHFAGSPDAAENYRQAEAAVQNNLMGTLNALEAFRLCRGRLFVYGDSCKVYGDCAEPYRERSPARPASSYAISKMAGWEFCKFYGRLYGIATTSVRPTLIYGPRQKYNVISYVIDSVIGGKPEVRLDGGAQTRTPLYIDDAIRAFLAVIKCDGNLSERVINIGGREELSVAELARIIVELMGREIPVVSIAMRARPTEMWRSFCDNREARRMIGWQPQTDLRAGLLRTIESIKNDRLKLIMAS